MSYLYMIGAILFEVAGTLLLPISANFTKLLPTIGLISCYVISFYLLTFAIKTIPIAIVYASWSGLGVFLVTIFSYFVFSQSLQWQALCGLALIIIGVGLVNFYSPHH